MIEFIKYLFERKQSYLMVSLFYGNDFQGSYIADDFAEFKDSDADPDSDDRYVVQPVRMRPSEYKALDEFQGF